MRTLYYSQDARHSRFDIKQKYAIIHIEIQMEAEASTGSIPDYQQLSDYISDVEAAQIPANTIIGLGEATHGNRDFTELKQQVFAKLVEEQGVRAFAVEGDFGGCQQVNEYIQSGIGTAAEAAATIGFAIYRTEEMVELLEWMKDFNNEREAAKAPEFEGYLKAKQPISMIGESFSKLSGASEMGYTQKLSPLETFDSLIFIDEAGPSVMLENNETGV